MSYGRLRKVRTYCETSSTSLDTVAFTGGEGVSGAISRSRVRV